MKEIIRAVLVEHGRLGGAVETLDEDADLYQAGMTSHASVNVMLAPEGELHIEFPDSMLHRSVFQSMSSIQSAVLEIRSKAMSAAVMA